MVSEAFSPASHAEIEALIELVKQKYRILHEVAGPDPFKRDMGVIFDRPEVGDFVQVAWPAFGVAGQGVDTNEAFYEMLDALFGQLSVAVEQKTWEVIPRPDRSIGVWIRHLTFNVKHWMHKSTALDIQSSERLQPIFASC